MKNLIKFLYFFIFAAVSVQAFAESSANIPVLCYHNLNPTARNSMTLTPEKFEAQIKLLKEKGFTIIPMKEAVEYLQGRRSSLPPKPVVISADDGWASVYTYMLPLAKKYNIPVTLFIYPQTISSGKNTLTWDQLKQLQQTGLFDIQGHTYSHPNFKQEKRRLSPAGYEKLIQVELFNSKKILEDKLGKKVEYLAWPFGIYDPYLEQAAQKAGYVMAFSIDDTTANRSHRAMSQPRFMIIDGRTMKTFEGIVNRARS